MSVPVRKPGKNYRITKMRLDEISLVDMGADPKALVTIFKRHTDSGTAAQPQGEGHMTELEKMAADMREAANTIATLTKRATDAETALAAANTAREAAEAKAVAITKMAESGETEDVILKAADPIVAAEIIKLRKAAATSAAALAVMTETAEVKKFADRIAADLSGLPVKPADFAPVLKRVAGAVSAEDMVVLDRILVAASNAMNQLAKSAVGGGLQVSDPEAAINEAAMAIAKAENVTLAKAHVLAMERNPALYDRFLAERGATN